MRTPSDKRNARAPQRARSRSAKAKPAPRVVARVLLVDSDDARRRQLARAMTEDGFQVVEAANGDAAARLFRSLRAVIDFSLVNMKMPPTDATLTIRRLKLLREDALVFVLVDHLRFDKAVRRALLDGASGVLGGMALGAIARAA